MSMQFDYTQVLDVLRNGGVILYPTDTIWGLGCDATNSKAVEKLYKIKGRETEKSLIILVENFDMLKKYVKEIPEVAYDLVENIKEPLTIIYDNAQKLAKYVAAKDKSVGIRIPNDDFCSALLSKFGKPITSSSANISGSPTPLYYSQIDDGIKKAVDYIVPINQFVLSRPKASTIIRINENKEIKVIRS
jgi:L-threonylcarbamoyladenylate synthase